MSDQNWNPNTPDPQQPKPANSEWNSTQWDTGSWNNAPQQPAQANYQQPNYPQPGNPAQPNPQATPWPVQQQWGTPIPQRPSGGVGGFMRALFDLSFTKYVTPSIVKVLYIISIIGVGLYWIGSVIALFIAGQTMNPYTGEMQTNDPWMFLAWSDLLFGWIFALAVIALIRMQYEYIVALIRTSEYARDIKAKLEAPDTGSQI